MKSRCFGTPDPKLDGVYKDIELPYSDAKVAEKICVGRQCNYLIREDSWNLHANIVPNLCQKVPESTTAFVVGHFVVVICFLLFQVAFSNPQSYIV
jgi:hypothetical protein